MARILVVDDDATVAEVVQSYLERAGHTVERAADGSLALSAVAAAPPDLIVLDLMLPVIGGLEVCRRVRAAHPQISIVMLTALAEEEDRIAGLELGADDYVTKPFSPRELILRVESILRRSAGRAVAGGSASGRGGTGPDADGQTHPRLENGRIVVDTMARRAFKDGVELVLTVREFDLLAYLMGHPGVAFSRAQLMAQVWGWTFGDQSTVTVHVRRLREKVEDDPAQPSLIQTVWGVGYRLDAPAVATTGSAR